MQQEQQILIGVCGKARVGKDTFAKYLIKALDKQHSIKLKQLAFADILKTMCQQHFELSDDQLWGNSKEDADRRFIKDKEELIYWTAREMMQKVGEFFRSIDYDYWIKALDKKIQMNSYKYVVITDVRYKNECEYIKNNNGLLIYISRDDKPQISNMTHSSEIELDGLKKSYFNLLVDNVGTLHNLNNIALDVGSNIFKLLKWVS